MPLRALSLLALAELTCGDNIAPEEILVQDPAVETGCAEQRPGAGQVRLKRVECDAELIGGPLAAGRVGDYLLENERIRLIVRGPGEGLRLHGTGGGGIVDAAVVGGSDQLIEIQPLFDWGAAAFDDFVMLRAGADGVAELVLRGRTAAIPLATSRLGVNPPSLLVEHRYLLSADASYVRIISRTFTGEGTREEKTELKDAVFWGGALRSFVPGVGTLTSASADGEAIAAAAPGVSYGFFYPPARTELVPTFNLNGFLFVGRSDVDPDGDSIERFFAVGAGDVSDVLAEAWTVRGVATGTIVATTEPGVAVIAERDGTAISRAIADPSGRAELVAPVGSYTLRVDDPAHLAAEGTAVEVSSAAPVEATVAAGDSSLLVLEVVDDGGQPIPARATLTDEDGGKQIVPIEPSGRLEKKLLPGRYDIDVSRGIEYSLYTGVGVELTAGNTTRVDAVLTREVDTGGWIAVDTHLHSEMSMDSTIPLADRVRAVAAEGIEVAISTDHDYVTDYTPIIEDLGYGDVLATQVGEEATSLVVGHINGWPLEQNLALPGAGAVSWFDRGPNEIADLLRDGDSDRIVQINHPRRGGSAFTVIDLDPESGMAQADPASLGLPTADFNDFNFDAVEVANGKSVGLFDEVFADWLGLLNAGHAVAATGASDSHRATRYAGRARTYVFVGEGNDDPASVDLAALNQALRNQRVVVSQGAFVTAHVEPPDGAEAGPGQMADLSGESEVNLHIQVQAAHWQPLTKIQIYERRELVREIALDPEATLASRYSNVVTLPLGDTDTFFVVRVESAGPVAPLLEEPAPSFTNPIYVDADGDGTWQ